MKTAVVSSKDLGNRLDAEFHVAAQENASRVQELEAGVPLDQAKTFSDTLANMLTQAQLGVALDPLRRTNRRRGMEADEFARVREEYPYLTLTLLESKIKEIGSTHLQAISQAQEGLDSIAHIQSALPSATTRKPAKPR